MLAIFDNSCKVFSQTTSNLYNKCLPQAWYVGGN